MTAQLEMRPLELIEDEFDFERIYTLEEFFEVNLPEYDEEGDEVDYELWQGKVVAKKKSVTSARHGAVIFKLGAALGEYIKAQPIGQGYSQGSCTLSQTDPRASYVEPDLAFALNERIPLHFTGALPIAPDLVVEINSPSDTTENIQNKILLYEKTGVRLIWSIYMVQDFAIVYFISGDDYDFELVKLSEYLDGRDILPGFRIKLKDIL